MNSFIRWVGGKRLLRKEILGCFSKDVGHYIEVFDGAGWVLSAKEKQAGQMEVYNDRDESLVNLYRCIKYHCSALQEELQWLLPSRKQLYDYRAQMDMRGSTGIQKAARFFYLLKISFGSDYRTFATSSKSIENAIDYLVKVQKRLQGVVIGNKDFENLIGVYDRKDALFYLDPPYVGTETHYNVTFTMEDHQRLAKILKNVKGKFILSYNDIPMIRELYSRYPCKEVVRNSTLVGDSNKPAAYRELIITNSWKTQRYSL